MEYTFTVTEFDPEKPWVALGTSTRTIEAPSTAGFWKRVEVDFPKKRFEVTPMVGQGF